VTRGTDIMSPDGTVEGASNVLSRKLAEMLVGRDMRSGPMTHMPMRRELSPLETSHQRGEAAKPAGPRLVTIVTNFELVMVAAFCALGLLATVMWCFIFPIME
jgi:hypothetical protein